MPTDPVRYRQKVEINTKYKRKVEKVQPVDASVLLATNIPIPKYDPKQREKALKEQKRNLPHNQEKNNLYTGILEPRYTLLT